MVRKKKQEISDIEVAEFIGETLSELQDDPEAIEEIRQELLSQGMSKEEVETRLMLVKDPSLMSKALLETMKESGGFPSETKKKQIEALVENKDMKKIRNELEKVLKNNGIESDVIYKTALLYEEYTSIIYTQLAFNDTYYRNKELNLDYFLGIVVDDYLKSPLYLIIVIFNYNDKEYTIAIDESNLFNNKYKRNESHLQETLEKIFNPRYNKKLEEIAILKINSKNIPYNINIYNIELFED